MSKKLLKDKAERILGLLRHPGYQDLMEEIATQKKWFEAKIHGNYDEAFSGCSDIETLRYCLGRIHAYEDALNASKTIIYAANKTDSAPSH